MQSKAKLQSMIEDLVRRTADQQLTSIVPAPSAAPSDLEIAQMLSAIEDGVIDAAELEQLRAAWRDTRDHHRLWSVAAPFRGKPRGSR